MGAGVRLGEEVEDDLPDPLAERRLVLELVQERVELVPQEEARRTGQQGVVYRRERVRFKGRKNRERGRSASAGLEKRPA